MAKSFRKYAWKKKTKAVVGIGTMIVFIAMVLTAAIASAVILKTAYSLKDSAERQGSMARHEVAGGIKVLDITGDRGSPVPGDIQQVKFMVTVWAGDPDGVNVAKLRVHWKGPTKEIVLNLDPLLGYNTAGPLRFAAEEQPIKATRTPDWDPAAGAFFLINENVIYILIDLTALNGINDVLSPGDTASIYFEPGAGLTVEETFTTPNSYGTNQFVDLTMM